MDRNCRNPNQPPKELKVAITGGTGFVGRNVARQLVEAGHSTVLIARGIDQRDLRVRQFPRTEFCKHGIGDKGKLEAAFAGCEAVVHCAGINREIGDQTYQRVHIEGTRNVVEAARRAGVRKIVMISFLRARPNCQSGYHESKFAAEQIVRESGLDYTILKCGVIYGLGDHMLDHLSHAFHTFPIFAFVGFRDQAIRPNAVEDVARVVREAAINGALPRHTVAVVGPDILTLREVVRKVARVNGRRPLMFPMPLWFHYAFAWLVERVMAVPLVSVAQVQMLAEGLAEPLPPCPFPEPELAPRIRFSDEQIRAGLPQAKAFTLADLRICRRAMA